MGQGAINFGVWRSYRLTIAHSVGEIQRGRIYNIHSSEILNVADIAKSSGMVLNGKVFGVKLSKGSSLSIGLNPSKLNDSEKRFLPDAQYKVSVMLDIKGVALIKGATQETKELPNGRLFTIGRGFANDLVVPARLTRWSKEHVELFWDQESLTLYIGEPSQLPTNGAKITAEA